MRLPLTSLLIRRNPVASLLLGYAFYSLIGWILLVLPFSQGDGSASALDSLFTAVSAISTTGLVSVTFPDAYSFAGQMVSLVLIQLGGIGYMTFGTYFVLAFRKNLPATRRAVGELSFTLPSEISVESIVRRAVLFTFALEAIGAVLLWQRFESLGQADALWHGIFHSISSFCTAGFSTFANSLENFAGDFWINLIVTVLSFAGALGFIVLGDVWALVFKRRPITFTTSVILWLSFSMVGVASLLLLAIPSGLSGPTPEDGAMIAFFQAMTAMTTVGFNTAPIGDLSLAATVILLALMLVGGSPSGTGGGMKTTTVSALIGVVRSNMKGLDHVELRGRTIPEERVRAAVAAVAFYLFTVLIGCFLLSLTQASAAFEDVIFEVVSAIGTVGLSRGLTGSLGPLGEIVVIGLMFAGRVGPLTLGLALLPSRANGAAPAEEEAALAEIAV